MPINKNMYNDDYEVGLNIRCDCTGSFSDTECHWSFVDSHGKPIARENRMPVEEEDKNDGLCGYASGSNLVV